MRRLHFLFLFSFLLVAGCAASRLSHDEARKRISELGTSSLVPDAIEIRRIISQGNDQAIAEATVTLAFQFRKDARSGGWKVEAVRLGDRDWVSLDELVAALNEGRRRNTTGSMQKIVAGIQNYQKANGSFPTASDIVELTDKLHPNYTSDLIRLDGWGHPLEAEVSGAAFRLISKGPDGLRGTADDIVLDSSSIPAP